MLWTWLHELEFRNAIRLQAFRHLIVPLCLRKSCVPCGEILVGMVGLKPMRTPDNFRGGYLSHMSPAGETIH